MANGNPAVPQDPWSVASQTPAPQDAPQDANVSVTPQAAADPWAVVSHVPAPAVSGQPSVAGRAWAATKQYVEGSLPVAAIKSAVTPPQDHKEELALTLGGPPALQAYRASRSLVNGVENIIKSPAENYEKFKTDFQRGVQDLQNRDYRNLPSDAISASADAAGAISPATAMISDRAREFSEGARPGGDLVTPTVKTALDAVSAAIAEKSPELLGAAKEVPGKIGDLLEKRAANKAALASSEDLIAAHQDFKKAIPSTKAAPYEEHDLLTAENYLEHHHENVEPIRGIQHTVDALDHSVAGIEDEAAKYVGLIPREPIATDVLADVKSALQQNERGAEFVNAGMKELESLNLDNIDMQRADSVRRQLNLENKAVLKENDYDLAAARASSPAFAAREAAAESLRNGIYNQMEAHGIEGAKELRQEEGSLLKVRNAAYNQLQNGEKVVRGSSGATTIQKIAAKTAQGAAAIGGAGIGATVGGVPGAMVGSSAGAVLGGMAADAIAPQDLTRDALIERRFGKQVATGAPGHITVPKGIQAPPPATPPVGTQGVIPLPIPPATPGTPAQPNLFGTTAPYPANAVLQSPQAQLASLQTQIRPLKAILDDPTATQAAKVEAARQLSALPLASLQNPTIETGASAAEKAAAAKTPLPTPVTTPQSIVEAAGGTFRGAYPNGMVEVTLPRSMTESLPIDNKLKDFVSVTIPKEKMTPEFIKSEMARKVGEITKGAEKKAAAIAEAKPVAKNASGESAASKEAISRIAAEKEAGITYSRVDTRSNVAKPLAPGVDIVDMKAGPYDRIVKHIPGKPDQVMDEGAKARPARGSFKDKLRSALTASGALGGENA